MREQVRTVGVWEGGGDPPPKSGVDGEGCCRETLRCILEDNGVQRLLKHYEIRADRILRCLGG